MSSATTVESTVFFSPRVFVFDLRGVSSNPGFKAAEFTANGHMWAGQLRINSDGEDSNWVVLEHDPSDAAGKTGIFARCEAKPEAVTQAIDSSRYFILRIYNNTGQYIQIAVGFNNKNDAFDFRHELASLSQKKQQLSSLPSNNTDFSLKTNISLDIQSFKPSNANTQPSDSIRSQQHVSRPQNVEKVTLSLENNTVRGRRHNNAASSSQQQQPQQQSPPSQQQQPQQQSPPSQQQSPPSQQQLQQLQSPQRDIFDFGDFGGALNNSMANTSSTDILTSMSSPQHQPQQQEPQQQFQLQQGLLDSFFSSDHSNATAKTKPTPIQQTTQSPVQSDPFAFNDDDFNF